MQRGDFKANGAQIIGLFVLAIVVLVTYAPSLNASLFHDDWWHLERAGRFSLTEYLRFYLDPRVQTLWYRPVQGLVLLIEYTLFHANTAGYHLSQMAFHLGNSLLLLALVQQLAQRWRLAIVSALVYAGLPAYSMAVIWPAVVDPQAVFFYLTTIWLWLIYIRTRRWRDFGLMLGAYILLLLSKEIGATLWLVLILVDRILIRDQVNRAKLTRRHAPFVLLLVPYLVLERYVQTQSWLVYGAGYHVGFNIIDNLIGYLGALIFPWDVNTLLNHLSLGAGVLIFLWLGIWKRVIVLLFLGLVAVLNVLPAIGFDSWYFQPRLIYLSAMCSAILLGLLLEVGSKKWWCQGWYGLLVSALVGLLTIVNGMSVSANIAVYAEMSRKSRVPFRDISQRHPSFPKDTYLYFIVPPASILVPDFSALFFLRDGANVTVDSTNSNQPAHFDEHQNAYVFYFDEVGRSQEVLVDKSAQVKTSRAMPLNFGAPLRLEGYAVTRTRVKRGDALVIFLYWKALGKMEKDYTVFAHLLNEHGEILVGYDSQPQQASSPTSTWRPNQFIVDSIIMPINLGVPAGNNYHLEIGLYYLPTMERVGLVDAAGLVIADTLVIEPFSIQE